MEESDVVILGAGVAGLFAAYQLVKLNFKGTITIIEQGPSMKERLSSKSATQDTLRGVGGPGLFTDGKICLSEKAGTKLTEFVDERKLAHYTRYIFGTVQQFLPEEDCTPSYSSDEVLVSLKKQLQKAGLELQLAYPVLHLGSDRVRQLALSLEAFLMQNPSVHLLTSTTAEAIKIYGDEIEIKLKNEANDQFIICNYLIAAVGKSSNDWLCKQLGISTNPNFPDIGIRLEFPNKITQELLKVIQNPRIVMEWDNTHIRTHCWCYGGQISTYNYLGSTFVDGEAYKSHLTPSTSVNLLYRLIMDSDPVKEVHQFFQNNRGYPLVQSLGEIKGDRQQRHYRFTGNTSSNIFQQAHLRGEFYNERIIEGFLEFIKRMGVIWPEIAHSSTTVYAPVLEWDTYHFKVDEHMRTSIPNVYAVGDGAGLSQGVVAAATCGLIAAEHLSQTYLNALPYDQSTEAINI